MKYDFENPPSRKGTDCYKWDLFGVPHPMWVADMDFKTAPEIISALRKRVDHGIYGYAIIPDSWRQAYVDFYLRRYGWDFNAKDVVFSLGVVPILSSSVRALTKEGDNVVIMPPVYNIFYNSIYNNNRNALEVPLVDRDGVYYIDFGQIEAAFASPKTTLCILCNPGNPTARIWSKEELNELAALARKHHVIILSDEIHGAVTRPGKKYVPFLADKRNEDIAFAAVSPTKAFNLAGLHTAALVCPNDEIKTKVERQLNTDEVAEPNVFSCIAAETAFNEGEAWLDECLRVLFDNRDFATSYINKEIPGLKAYEGDATYLLWVDCSEVEPDAALLLKYIETKKGIVFNDGLHYGQGGQGHFRINLACPKKHLRETLALLKEAIEDYLK